MSTGCFNTSGVIVGGLKGTLCRIIDLLNYVVPVLIALGVVYFVWGVVMYVIADGEEAKTKGRNHMIFGIIGLAVIVSMWGLVNLVITTFGVGSSTDTTYTPSADQIKGLLPQ